MTKREAYAIFVAECRSAQEQLNATIAAATAMTQRAWEEYTSAFQAAIERRNAAFAEAEEQEP